MSSSSLGYRGRYGVVGAGGGGFVVVVVVVVDGAGVVVVGAVVVVVEDVLGTVGSAVDVVVPVGTTGGILTSRPPVEFKQLEKRLN